MEEIYTEYSFYDLKTVVSLKTEEKICDALQFYESVGLIISQALGAKPQEKSKPAENADELEAKLMRVLG